MKKKTILITLLFIAVMITSCHFNDRPQANDSEARVGRFGPNSDTNRYFTSVNDDPAGDGDIVTAFNLDSNSSKAIFQTSGKTNIWVMDSPSEDVIQFIADDGNDEKLYTYQISADTLGCEKYIEPVGQNHDSSTSEAELFTGDYGIIHFTKHISDPKYYCTIGDETFELNGVGGSAFNKSGIYSSDLTYLDGVVYIRLTAIIGIGHGPQGIPITNGSYNAQIKKDVLYSFNPKTRECHLIYDTKGNSARIVGYKNGACYLFKDNILMKYDAGSKITESIQEFQNGHKLIFYWYSNDLLVFDATDDTVLTVIYDN